MNEISREMTAGKELVQSIPINMIEQSCDLNPRKKIEEYHLRQITQNIRQHGLLTPLLLYKNDENKLQVIAGLVRLNAAKSLGLTEVPARILEVDEEEARLLALKTNLEPEDHALTALEVSVAIQE
ncbi:MAG: ParB N-terminal domain-containing protein, partial [Thaumarchaeota archaeon]|nr:ParB N-terminal domain-containing protein [Nitrososphaerota archaeon]